MTSTYEAAKGNLMLGIFVALSLMTFILIIAT